VYNMIHFMSEPHVSTYAGKEYAQLKKKMTQNEPKSMEEQFTKIHSYLLQNNKYEVNRKYNFHNSKVNKMKFTGE
jgi:hypothetical protein